MSRYCKHGIDPRNCSDCPSSEGLEPSFCSAFVETKVMPTNDGYASKVEFSIGNQSFTLDYEGDKESSAWMARQLCKALKNGGMDVVPSLLIDEQIAESRHAEKDA